jgi:hypothetical protein
VRQFAIAAMCPVLLVSASLPFSHGSREQDVVQRFLSHQEAVPLTQYRATRHMRARNERFRKEARLHVRTTLDQVSGFRYDILTQEGSGIIRDRALIPILKAEARALSDGTAARSALTPANYEFFPGQEDGCVQIRPRRRDVLLVQGAILVAPDDGDLLRIEGRLAKNPSFWTSRVEVTREYQRIGSVRVPIRVVSRAWVKLVGVSTFEMTYDYEEINGQPVSGGPPTAATSASPNDPDTAAESTRRTPTCDSTSRSAPANRRAAASSDRRGG